MELLSRIKTKSGGWKPSAAITGSVSYTHLDVYKRQMKDCLAYFHLSPVWEKVLKGFREKYISYGRFGGKVILKNLKPADIEELLSLIHIFIREVHICYPETTAGWERYFPAIIPYPIFCFCVFVKYARRLRVANGRPDWMKSALSLIHI